MLISYLLASESLQKIEKIGQNTEYGSGQKVKNRLKSQRPWETISKRMRLLLAAGLFLGQTTGLGLRKPLQRKHRARGYTSVVAATTTEDGDFRNPSEVFRGRLKGALVSDGGGESLREALLGCADAGGGLLEGLRPLVGAKLALLVVDLVTGDKATAPPTKANRMAMVPGVVQPLGDFEARALELMAAGRWLEAHDVLAGQRLDEKSPAAAHAHEAIRAARLLEAVCQYELEDADGLEAALAAHEADKTNMGATLPCGCAVNLEAVEPFAALASAVGALDAGDPYTALGYSLIAGLARPTLSTVAAGVAKRAETELESIVEVVGSDEKMEQLAGDDESTPATSQNSNALLDLGSELPAMASLRALVGLKEAKARCENLRDAVALEKERERKSTHLNSSHL